MSCNSLVYLFLRHQNPATDKPFRRIKQKQATDLVRRGIAEVIGELSLRYCGHREIVRSSMAIPKGNHQGEAYESAAIDTNPRFFQGGLTRNEHQPKKFEPFKNARVGHQ